MSLYCWIENQKMEEVKKESLRWRLITRSSSTFLLMSDGKLQEIQRSLSLY